MRGEVQGTPSGRLFASRRDCCRIDVAVYPSAADCYRRGGGLPLGASKFGGQPDLPAGFEWPYTRADLLLGGFSDLNDLNSEFEYTARGIRYPLAFVAQLNLAEFAHLDLAHQLPEEGILYFFFDHMWYYEAIEGEEYRSWITLYHPSSHVDGVNRLPYPNDLQTKSRFKERALGVRLETSLPSYSKYDQGLVKRFAMPDLRFTDDEYDSYRHLREIYAEVDEEEGSPTPIHRLLGYPEPVQGNMQLDCQLGSHGILDWEDPRVESLATGATDWRLLLQIDTDLPDQFISGQDEFLWGDCGRLYFWIRKQDLRDRNFDQIWMILQCH
ncbi:MAG: YwqG family protein [Thermomicrobiales bacterium]